MLKIPAIRKIGDVTVYEDDTVWSRFYLLPSIPSIRRDKNGQPVFLLAIYHFSDQARETRADLPGGGGYMNFDVQFAVSEAETTAAVAELQKWVNEEYARRRLDPAYRNLPEYAAIRPPTVELADPLLSGGKVSMETTQSAALATARFAEAPASLVSGSTAVFNIDLTEMGASFMKDLMVDSEGRGTIDLTPVQVIYDLKMWARMPPVLITVKGDSARIQSTLQAVSQSQNNCTPREIEKFRETGVNSASLRESGYIEVHIDKGDASLPEEAMLELQKFALDLFDKMIESRFLEPVKQDSAAAEPLGFEGDLPASPFRTSRVKLRQSLDVATMKLEIKVDRSQVVEWPLVGEATMETFFSGASKEEIGRHVVTIIPDDFNTLGVTVQVFVNFEQSQLQAVEVQTEYTSEDSTGVVRTTPGAYTFRTGATEAKRFDPAVIEGKREYRYRYRVILDDGSVGEYTPWAASTNRALNIAVIDPGKLSLDVSAAGLNWDLLRDVAVHLAYLEAAGAPPVAEHTFELTAAAATRKWEQRLTASTGGYIEAQATYFFKEDKVVKGDPQKLAVTDNLFVVPPPQVDLLNVGLLPAGDWSDVAQAAVSLEYDAAGGLVYDKTFRFTKIEEFAEWAVLLRDPARRGFRYRTIVVYKNGTPDDSLWKSAEGDQTIAIQVKGVPKLRVNVLSNLVDFKSTPAVTVSLSYSDQRKTLSFTEPKAQLWETPLQADGSREYAYEVTWFPADGDPILYGPVRTAETELFVRKAQTPKAGKLDVIVRGFAVDYTVTPYVDVTLSVKRDGGDLRKTIALAADQKNQTWSVDVGDGSQRRYHYEVVYNFADGSRKTGASGDSEDPVISVTAYRP